MGRLNLTNLSKFALKIIYEKLVSHVFRISDLKGLTQLLVNQSQQIRPLEFILPVICVQKIEVEIQSEGKTQLHILFQFPTKHYIIHFRDRTFLAPYLQHFSAVWCTLFTFHLPAWLNFHPSIQKSIISILNQLFFGAQ